MKNIFKTIIIIFCLIINNSYSMPDRILGENFNINDNRESDPDLYWEWENNPRWLSGVGVPHWRRCSITVRKWMHMVWL